VLVRTLTAMHAYITEKQTPVYIHIGIPVLIVHFNICQYTCLCCIVVHYLYW